MTDTTISMPQLKGPETKKANNKHRNRHNSYHALLTLKMIQDMREQAQIKRTN